MTPTSNRCSASVYRDHGLRHDRCERRGVVEEGGKRWCRQHAPSAVAARNAKANEKFEAIVDANRRRSACFAACEGVDDPQPGELKRLREWYARTEDDRK